MEPKRDVYDSAQQWLAANIENPSPEVTKAVLLLWRDMDKMNKQLKLRNQNLEKTLKRRESDLELLKKRMKI
jgi:hypothetical protein